MNYAADLLAALTVVVRGKRERGVGFLGPLTFLLWDAIHDHDFEAASRKHLWHDSTPSGCR